MDIDELNERFGIEGEIGFMELDGDLPFIMVTNKYAEADICLYGAQITSYRPVGTTDVLWMSPYAVFEKEKAIRGGIPVCFPWFGPHKTDLSLPQHGFARTSTWEVKDVKTLENGQNYICFQLKPSAQTKSYWPHDFIAEMRFVVGNTLSVSLNVINTSDESFSYTAALHSYFNLSSIENLKIGGLQNARYENQLDGSRNVQKEAMISISDAMTRHYFETKADCILYDPYFNRNIRIAKTGSKCTTIWNPWAETCANMNDMPNNGYETFVCVETANNINDRIDLLPGESHETTAIISVDPVDQS